MVLQTYMEERQPTCAKERRPAGAAGQDQAEGDGSGAVERENPEHSDGDLLEALNTIDDHSRPSWRRLCSRRWVEVEPRKPAERCEHEALLADGPVKAGTPAGQGHEEGVERPRVDRQDVEPAVFGLPVRRKCFTTATRRAMRAAGPTFFTALLCTTTVLMNSLRPAEMWEINGVNPHGHFATAAADIGVTYEGFYADHGHQVEKQNVTNQVIAELYAKTPAFVWFASPVRSSPKQPGIDTSPEKWRNQLRGQRRCKDIAWELAKGACAQLDGGRHFAWEWPYEVNYGHDCAATQMIFATTPETLGVTCATSCWMAAPILRRLRYMARDGASSPRAPRWPLCQKGGDARDTKNIFLHLAEFVFLGIYATM